MGETRRKQVTIWRIVIVANMICIGPDSESHHVSAIRLASIIGSSSLEKRTREFYLRKAMRFVDRIRSRPKRMHGDTRHFSFSINNGCFFAVELAFLFHNE